MSVDLGSEWMKMAIVKPGVPMEIVLNKWASVLFVKAWVTCFNFQLFPVSISPLRCILFSNTSYLPVPSPYTHKTSPWSFSTVPQNTSQPSQSGLAPKHAPSLWLPPLLPVFWLSVSKAIIMSSLCLTVNSGYLGTPTGNEGVLAWSNREELIPVVLFFLFLGSRGGKPPQLYVWRKMKDFLETVRWEWSVVKCSVGYHLHTSDVGVVSPLNATSNDCSLLHYFSPWRTPELCIYTCKASSVRSMTTSRWRSIRNASLSTNFKRTQSGERFTLNTLSEFLSLLPLAACCFMAKLTLWMNECIVLFCIN